MFLLYFSLFYDEIHIIQIIQGTTEIKHGEVDNYSYIAKMLLTRVRWW